MNQRSVIQKNPNFERYRPNVGVVLTNNKGLIFYCERADIPDAWQLPQGGIDQGEAPEIAVLRELFEETGIKDVAIKNSYPDWLVYDFPEGTRTHTNAQGQAQKWFLLSFTGDPDSINLQNAQDKEFTNFMWATPKYILETIVPFRKPLYQECFRHFKLI